MQQIMPKYALGVSGKSSRILFPVLLLILSFFSGQQVNAQSEETSDQVQVMQKCIDLEGLQSFYPKNRDGSFKTLKVMQHAISFPHSIAVSHRGRSLDFIGKGEATGGFTEAYFLFNQFQITGRDAWVELVFYYDQSGSVGKMQVVSLKLQKNGSTWTITQSKIEGRDS